MAHCAANLKPDGVTGTRMRAYCACMSEFGDDADRLVLDQRGLERTWPPGHVYCRRKAGLK